MTQRPTRVTPFDKGTTPVLAVLGAGAVLLAAFWWFAGRPQSQAVPSERGPAVVPVAASAAPSLAATTVGDVTPGATSAPGSASTSGATVTVDVRGRVASPGIWSLPAGSRVMDAIAAAGGKTAGSHYGPLNLARVLSDGEQIRVGVAPTDESVVATSGPDPAPDGAPPTGTLINLNSASAVELEEVDGVGPVLAAAIVAWRTDNGPFQSVDELLDVSGIGEATLAGMRPQVTVG